MQSLHVTIFVVMVAAWATPTISATALGRRSVVNSNSDTMLPFQKEVASTVVNVSDPNLNQILTPEEIEILTRRREHPTAMLEDQSDSTEEINR